MKFNKVAIFKILEFLISVICLYVLLFSDQFNVPEAMLAASTADAFTIICAVILVGIVTEKYCDDITNFIFTAIGMVKFALGGLTIILSWIMGPSAADIWPGLLYGFLVLGNGILFAVDVFVIQKLIINK